MLPNRHLVLEPVDQQPTRSERLPAVNRRNSDDDRQVSDGELSYPMDSRDGYDWDLRRHLASYSLEPAQRRGMRRVLELFDASATVIIAYGAHEQGGSTGARIGDGGQAFVR